VHVLCDVGDALDYISPDVARHDDGRFAAYRRYFAGNIPFVQVPRDQEVVAKRLGIKPFEVEFVRRDAGPGVDVTEEVADLLGDRVAEFLAIVVHHSLGSQTLELDSAQFHDRSRRLLQLRVVRVAHLALDAAVVGADFSTSIGEEADFDVFLDGPTSTEPVIYHDLSGDDWKHKLRRKLADNVAAILENPSYSATFTLFLQQDSDADREDFLLGLGITGEDVDAVRSALGVVSEGDRLSRERWFTAICDALGASPKVGVRAGEETALAAAGITPELAKRLVELGGSAEVRTDTRSMGALHLLANAGLSLERLHSFLLALHDPGLAIRIATDSLREWRARYGRHVAAVLATKIPDSDAKLHVELWACDPKLDFVLEPDQVAVLAPVIEDLRSVGLDPRPPLLASDNPTIELARLGGCADVAELNDLVRLLFDEEERTRILRRLASDWRRELRLIAVLLRAAPHGPRSATRLHAEEADVLLPPNPDRPSALTSSLAALLAGAGGLQSALALLLVDDVTANPPDRREIGELLREHGLDPSRLDDIQQILDLPARTEARRLRGQIDQLSQQSIRVAPPSTRTAAPPKRRGKSSVVRTIHVAEGGPRRQQAGEEGERWALAAIIEPLLDARVRQRAVSDIVQLLSHFTGEPVERALAHADKVMSADLDDEEAIDELTSLLHVSRYSDDFGFDLLGWLSPGAGADPIAMCLEVKSSGDATFHISAGEWDRASQIRDDGLGDR
jgi:hypothetical protein